MKKYIAEAFGTGVLALTVALSLSGSFVIATPVLAALVLGLFVYSVGHVSGTHINPAVTMGLWSIGKITMIDAVKYVGAQFIGAAVALILLSLFMVEVAPLVVLSDLRVGLAEVFGTMLFTFGIASVVFGRTPGVASGLVIGGSLLLGIAVAALLGSNGVLNPAVALTIGSFGVMYVVAPIIGSVLGMQLYAWLHK